MAYQPRARMLFCDWHMPSFLPRLDFDLDDYFRGVKQTGAQSLIFMCKTAHGGSFWPTKVGVRNPSLSVDLVGEVSRRTKALRLEFIAYYNVVLSWDLPRLHPEWAQLGRDGQPLRMFLYPCSCMSWDGFRDYVAEHLAEIARDYPIDGFFLDLQYFSPQGCFCAACRDKFAARFGYPLDPEAFGTRQWQDLLTYQVDTREAFLAALRERCNQEQPGLSWSWNGCGSPASISATLHHGAHYLSTEAHPPEYLHAEHATRYCEGLGLPFTLFMPESQGSWGDWTVTTAATIQGLSAVALAHGGSLNVNHVPYPCGERGGTVPQPIWDTIAATFDFVAEREAHCLGKPPVPCAAVLRSATNALLLQAMARGGQGGWLGGETYANEHALADLLLRSHTPWEILPAEIADDELAAHAVVILPGLPYVDDALADRLRAYLQGGGRLVVNHLTSLYNGDGERLPNFSLADLLGVDYVADSPYSIAYLDRVDPALGVADLPLLLKDPTSGRLNPANHALYCRLRPGARQLAELMDPALESDFEGGRFIYHDHAPPATLTGHPGVVVNQVGAGQVVYLPVPFLKGYATKHCPSLRRLFEALLRDVLGVPQLVTVDAPAAIHSALRQDDAGWLLHLIDLQRETDSIYLSNHPWPGAVPVTVRPPWPVAAVEDALTAERLPHEAADGGVRFVVAGVPRHGILRIRRA